MAAQRKAPDKASSRGRAWAGAIKTTMTGRRSNQE
jgi:hypothetical protein